MHNIEKFLYKYSLGSLLDYLARETKKSKKLQLFLLILKIVNIVFLILFGILLIFSVSIYI